MPTKVPEMDADFARWYADAFMDTTATRDARWKAVTEIATAADHITVEVLVRFAYATKAPPAGHKNEDIAKAHTGVLAAFAKDDPAFNASQSARELQILGAATLVRLFGFKPDSALAVSTASFAGVRKPELPMDIAGLAERALVELSGGQHTRLDPKSLEIAPPKLTFAVREEAVQNFTATYWKEEVERLRNGVGNAFDGFTASVNGVVKKLLRRVALGDEELQMLWWLTAGSSKELGRPFAKIDAPMRSLILGNELGCMTTISPGPASVGAMLSRAGVGSDEIKVQDAVNGVEPQWAAAVSSHKAISPATTPIHFALEKRNELGSTEAWQAGWAALTGLPAEIALPAVKLGELFYREHLFLLVNA